MTPPFTVTIIDADDDSEETLVAIMGELDEWVDLMQAEGDYLDDIWDAIAAYADHINTARRRAMN
jgi:hypothetical protein